jgi:hypothetical protein
MMEAKMSRILGRIFLANFQPGICGKSAQYVEWKGGCMLLRILLFFIAINLWK